MTAYLPDLSWMRRLVNFLHDFPMRTLQFPAICAIIITDFGEADASPNISCLYSRNFRLLSGGEEREYV